MKVPPQSKKRLKESKRKANQLQSKRIKIQQRESNIKAIQENSLDPFLSSVLQSSKSLGNTQTLKNKLKVELQKEKLGLTHSDVLFSHKIVNDNDFSMPELIKFPIYKIASKPLPDSPELPSIIYQTKAIYVEKPIPEEEQGIYIPVLTAEINQTTLMGYTENSQTINTESISKNNLPIIDMEQEIIENIRYNHVVIVSGETGSGKSTQLPRFLIENGFADKGRIGITQPRRIAAISLAKRVSEELGFNLGKEVGYQVRYDSQTISKDNIIKFMTDGILLKEIDSDFLLKEYSVIIIDEAHERTINTDILLGLLSRIVPLRAKRALQDQSYTELRLVIMSATLRVSDFTENKQLFPTLPPVISIDSRQFPVTTHFTKKTDTAEYLAQVSQKAQKIHRNLPPGGILIFVPGKKEVLSLKSELRSILPKSEVQVLGLYSMLSLKSQLKIFSPNESKRLIVVATNVAETSITIPHIVYVIDSGLEKRKIYSTQLQMSKYEITYISKASASQRAGRAGRTAPGHCYRLYSNAAFSNAFEDFRVPDICTSPLSPIILQLKSIGIKNILKFPFPTPPPVENLEESLRLLVDLGALTQCRKGTGDIYEITELGKEMSHLPIAPRYAKMLVVAKKFNVEKWMCPVVAGMEIEQIFDMDFNGDAKEKMTKAKKFHSKWFTGGSDCISALNVFLKFAQCSSTIEEFSLQEKIIEKSLLEMKKLTIQLLNLVTGEKKHSLTDFLIPFPSESNKKALLKSIASGFLDQIGLKVEAICNMKISKRVPYHTQQHLDTSLIPEDYKSSGQNLAYSYVHPSSYFFRRSPPQLIAYQHLSFITRPSLINITEINSEWLYELGNNFLHDIKVLEGSQAYFDIQNDQMNTWITANYGKKMWGLPAAYMKFPECDEKYSWFARLLLEGKVVLGEEMSNWWKVKISNMTEKGCIRIQKILLNKQIDTRSKLAKAVSQDENFLINEMLLITKEQFKEDVKACWKLAGIL